MNRRIALLLSLTGVALLCCKVPNPDHCWHKALDPNSWCANQHADRPFCSPCAEDEPFHGCVAVEPDPETCPSYVPPGQTGTGTGTATDTDTGTTVDTTATSTDETATTSG